MREITDLHQQVEAGEGGPQSIPDGSYIFVHMLGGGLSHGGLAAVKWWGRNVNGGPRPMSNIK